MREEWSDVLADIPVLDYERLSGFEIPARVIVTAIACSPVFCAIGTSVGGIQVVPIDERMGRGFTATRFSSPVTAISIDASSDALCFIAGATGQIAVVENLQSTTPTLSELPKMDASHCPLNAVAIAPTYSSESKRIVLGGATGDLVVVSRDVPPLVAISRTSSKGPVTAVEWREDVLVFAGPEFGLKAVNTKTSQRIVHLNAPSKNITVVYLGNSRFLVNTGFRLTIIEFSGTVCRAVLAMELPADQFAPNSDLGRLLGGRERLVGFGLFDSSELSLTMVTVEENRVTHHVIDTVKRDMPFSDLLPISGHSVVTAFSAGASPYMAIGCGDAVLRASRRSIAANALWMIDRGLFEEALEFSKLADETVQEFVAARAVAPLVQSHAFSRAVGLAPKLRLANQQQWSSFIDQFISLQSGVKLGESLKALVPAIPYPPRDSVTLSKSDYEKVVESLLRNVEWSFMELLEAVRRWPVGLYSASPLKDALIDLVPENFSLDTSAKSQYVPTLTSVFPSGTIGANSEHLRNIALMLALKSIYDQTESWADSLDILLRLGCAGEIVHVLSNRAVTDAGVRSWFDVNMLSLFQADARAISHFVMRHPLLFPTPSIIAELEPHPFFFHVFLRELFTTDPASTRPYHHRQVELFVQFDRDRLVDFLRQADGYDAESALAVVRRARIRATDLVEPEALLMWKAGNRKEAVALLIDVSKDVAAAVKFATSVQDPELWESIVARVRVSDTAVLANYIEALLESDCVPAFTSPENLVLTMDENVGDSRLLAVFAKVLARQKTNVNIEAARKALIASDWEMIRAETRPWDRGTVITNRSAPCRICGCSAVNPPPGGDSLDTHALPESIASSIPLHARTRAVLSVVNEGHLVHARCLTRTAIESAFSA